MIAWTYEKQTRALADGWGVFENSDNGLRIERYERYDCAGRFDCDAAAQAYVAVRAMNGDALAVSAWREIAWHHAVLDAADDEQEGQDRESYSDDQDRESYSV